MPRKTPFDKGMPMDLTDSIQAVEEKFCQVRQLVGGVAEAKLRHLFIVGPGGIGKTYTIEAELKKYAAPSRGGIRVRKLAGHVAPLALYKTLYDHRTRRDVLLLDDCDSALKNVNAANLIKAATDTRPDRVITWSSTSSRPPVDDFIYDGRIIICTNHKPKGDVITPVLDRFMMYRLELTADERVARIIAVLNGQFRSHPEFGPHVDSVFAYMIKWYARLGENLTLRTAVKCLELAAYQSQDWERLADAVIMES